MHPVHQAHPEALEKTRVLTKTGDDRRQWFHFIPFEVVDGLHNGYDLPPHYPQ